MQSLSAAAAVWALLGGAKWLEQRRLTQCTGAIPHRILVGGLRGKTTLTRLLHTGLQAEGLRCLARISGDAPMVLQPDQTEVPFARRGEARVVEIARWIACVPPGSVDALIVENMAIDAELAGAVATHMVRPTLAIMVGGGPDHLETFSMCMHERDAALAQALPPGIPVIVPPGMTHASMAEACSAAGCAVAPVVAGPFTMRPHIAELASAALSAVRVIVGHDAESAARALQQAAGGWDKIPAVRIGDVCVLDALSANDPASAQTLWRLACREAAARGLAAPGLVLNHRRDRPTRFPAFHALLSEAPHVCLIGDALPWHWRKFQGRWPHLGAHAETALGQLLKHEHRVWMSVGNATGAGVAWRAALVERGESEAW